MHSDVPKDVPRIALRVTALYMFQNGFNAPQGISVDSPQRMP